MKRIGKAKKIGNLKAIDSQSVLNVENKHFPCLLSLTCPCTKLLDVWLQLLENRLYACQVTELP